MTKLYVQIFGGSGPRVVLQMPRSSLVSRVGSGRSGGKSPVTPTAVARGAHTRNVTVRSGPSSTGTGESAGSTTGDGGCAGGGFCAPASGRLVARIRARKQLLRK